MAASTHHDGASPRLHPRICLPSKSPPPPSATAPPPGLDAFRRPPATLPPESRHDGASAHPGRARSSTPGCSGWPRRTLAPNSRRQPCPQVGVEEAAAEGDGAATSAPAPPSDRLPRHQKPASVLPLPTALRLFLRLLCDKRLSAVAVVVP